jgi:hypothetical protein
VLHTKVGATWAFFFGLKKERRVTTVKRFRVLSGLFVALLLVVAAETAMAQSTIFNIPSTDTVDKGKAYVEFDFLPQAPGPDLGSRTILYNPRIVVGLPHDAEFGLNFPTFHSSATNGYIQPNFKWKFYKNDDEGVALDGGTVLNTPLNNRTGQGTWAYFYGEVSKKVKSGMHGPRFTFGAYGVAANEDPTTNPVSFFGPRGGGILGYEQPISSKVSFVADWFSGKSGLGGASSTLGYFTPGISITLPGNGLFNAGYSIGNDSWANSNATKNRYVFVYYGVTF